MPPRKAKNNLVWDKKVPNTKLEDFRKKISKKYNIHLDDYWDLHKWSIDHFERFWEEAWAYFDIKVSKPHDKVFNKIGDGFMDVEWFPGLLFNAAETFLKIRDDRLAIIYSDETGYEERVTFAEMYAEVKLYSAAFRKHGLQKNDTVACYISNRKEAIFIYIAALSIGAIFSGPQTYFGAKAASNVIQLLEPKFLISIDHCQYNGKHFHNIDNLPEIVKDAPFLKKVIIIPTRQETNAESISKIPNSCLLREFLQSGVEVDGSIPDILFEQLPFNHPSSIVFTSGTSGIPKGIVHSNGSILTRLMCVVFNCNFNPGDIFCLYYTPALAVWNGYIHCLAYGVTLFLYAGEPCYERQGSNVWDLFSQYQVTHALFTPYVADVLEVCDVKPAPDSNLEHLKMLFLGSSRVSVQNVFYLKSIVNKDVFIGTQYGASEFTLVPTGVDFNLPCYAGESQAPGLGMNMQCFNNQGKHVEGERGEMVLATPTIALPLRLWKDPENKIMKETYLSKFPGCWCQNDEIEINPETKGIIVIGRSDDTLKQYGQRFSAGDIYCAIHDVKEIKDYICVSQTRYDGETRAVLFVKMKEEFNFTPEFKMKLEKRISDELWYKNVPKVILETKDIPYNLNNKRMESVVKKILTTNEIPEFSNIKNPECLTDFCNRPEIVNFMKV